MSNNILLDDFTNKSNKIHNNKYNYSKVEYKNAHSRIIIICPIHGEFIQLPRHHVRGIGCPKCGAITISQKKSSNTEEFILKAKQIHGDLYDYSLVDYKSAKTKVKITCSIHGVFRQTPDQHISNHCGCPRCYGRDKSTEDFIIEAKSIHGDLYDYSLTNYKTVKEKVLIICKKHGEFKQTPDNHLHLKRGCPICCSSKGEIEIREWLTRYNIKFTPQKRFVDCKYKYTLPFDFYLPEHNMCIEYDGIQHFKPVAWSKHDINNIKRFEETKIKDKIKDEYCKNNNIHLLRIKYDEDINQVLLEWFSNNSRSASKFLCSA